MDTTGVLWVLGIAVVLSCALGTVLWVLLKVRGTTRTRCPRCGLSYGELYDVCPYCKR